MDTSSANDNNNTAHPIIIDTLSKRNAHPRDAFIEFEEEGHIYTVHGERGTYTSATTFLGQLDEPFNAQSVAETKYLSECNRPDSRFFATPMEEAVAILLKEWDDKRDKGSSSGTHMHLQIERYLNEDPHYERMPEMDTFLQFRKDHPYLKPFRTEWCVYHEEAKLCGSIDCVFQDMRYPSTFYIYDWKRTKSFEANEYEADQVTGYKKPLPAYKMFNREFCNDGITPNVLKGLPKTKHITYSMQLCLYEYILKHKYNFPVAGKFLVRIHSELLPNQYEHVACKELGHLVEALVQYRIEAAAADAAAAAAAALPST